MASETPPGARKSLMGWKLEALAFLFALWSIGDGALVVVVPVLLYLFYRFWSNRQSQRARAGGRIG